MEPLSGASFSEQNPRVDRIEMQNMVMDLIRAAVESRESLRAAAHAAEDGQLAQQLESLADTRSRLIATLFEVAADHGVSIKDFDITSVGTVSRGWMKLRGSVTGDRGLVRAVLRTERHALSDFEKALDRHQLGRTLRAIETGLSMISDSLTGIESAWQELRESA